jgi:hypothetical protein
MADLPRGALKPMRDRIGAKAASASALEERGDPALDVGGIGNMGVFDHRQ